jgi:hypothetical protein
MVDVAVQGLVHSEHKLGHATSFPQAGYTNKLGCANDARLAAAVFTGRAQ